MKFHVCILRAQLGICVNCMRKERRNSMPENGVLNFVLVMADQANRLIGLVLV